MTIVESLRDALQEPNPQRSQARVHDIIARRLDDLTPRSSVRKTGYFNHSRAPDLVLETDDVQERGVFLRFDLRDPSFRDDLRYLSDSAPMFLDLAPANPSVVSFVDIGAAAPLVDSELDATAEQGVMVTDALAIEHLDQIVSSDRDAKLATQHVVVGGRGHIDLEAASLIGEGWFVAARAAAQADSLTLRGAMDRVEHYLSDDSSRELESTLRATWMAAGQTAETFPGREEWTLTGGTPREIARLVLSLLDSGAPVGSAQWRAIARSVSASDVGHELAKIGAHRSGGSVNDFIAAGLEYWTAQYAYVPSMESDSMERFDCSVGKYSLGIGLISRHAYFTDIGVKWSRVPRSTWLPPARERLPMLRTSDVRGAGLVTSEENIRETLRVSARASLADRLEHLITDEQDYAFRAARLESLEVRVPGTAATAHIEFHRNVVRTTAPVPLRTFVMVCARFVAGLEEAEMADLESHLTAPVQ